MSSRSDGALDKMQLESRKMLHVRMDTTCWRGAKGARECGPSSRTSKHHVHHAHHAHRTYDQLIMCAINRTLTNHQPTTNRPPTNHQPTTNRPVLVPGRMYSMAQVTTYSSLHARLLRSEPLFHPCAGTLHEALAPLDVFLPSHSGLAHCCGGCRFKSLSRNAAGHMHVMPPTRCWTDVTPQRSHQKHQQAS